MRTMEEIERLTASFATARSKLKGHVTRLEAEYCEAKKYALPIIKLALEEAARCEAELKAAVGESRGLFTKPKSHILNGIKVGWAKGKGKIEFADAGRVVKLIRKHLPDLAEVLIKVKESPNKKTLLNLQAAQIKKLGCSVVGAGEGVVVKPVDGEIDKLVDALLGKAADEAEDAE